MTFLPGYNCSWNYTKACGAADEPCEAGYKGANPACRAYFEVARSDGSANCSGWRMSMQLFHLPASLQIEVDGEARRDSQSPYGEPAIGEETRAHLMESPLFFGRGVERVAEFLPAADVPALRLLSSNVAVSPLYALGKRALLSRVAAKKPQKRLVALRACLFIGREAQDALLAAFETDRTQLVRAGAARLLARLAKALPVDDRATIFRRVDARYGKELRMATCRTAIEESFVDVLPEAVLARDFPGLLLSDFALESLLKKREIEERKREAKERDAMDREELISHGYMRWFDRHAREMMSCDLCPASHQVFGVGRCTKRTFFLREMFPECDSTLSRTRACCLFPPKSGCSSFPQYCRHVAARGGLLWQGIPSDGPAEPHRALYHWMRRQPNLSHKVPVTIICDTRNGSESESESESGRVARCNRCGNPAPDHIRADSGPFGWKARWTCKKEFRVAP